MSKHPKTVRTTNRRGFLRITGGAAVAAALAPHLTAQAATAPKRLVVIYTPDGTVHDKWRPSGKGTSFTLANDSILKPLETAGLREDMLILDGIQRVLLPGGPGTVHDGFPQILTARPEAGDSVLPGGPSVDEYIHQHISGGRPALRLSVMTSDASGTPWRMSYGANGNPLNPRNSPYEARKDMFQGFDPSGGGPSAAELRAASIRERVLGYTATRVEKMRSLVGASDSKRLLSHEDALNALAMTGTPMSNMCSLDTVNAWQPGIAVADYVHPQFPALTKMHMELIASAFACDRARVATLQFSETVSPIVHSWATASAGHHDISHNSPGYAVAVQEATLTRIYTWFAQQIATFAADLKTKGLLDNTCIVWLSDMGDGTHSIYNIPMVILGGANHFVTGQYVDYRKPDGVTGVSSADVLTSLCNAMGLNDTSFGDPRICKGPLTGVT